MRSLARLGILALMSLATGCLSLEEGTAQPPSEVTPTAQLTEDAAVPTPRVPPTSTINPDFQRIFYTYQHESNVFSISMPETWTPRDESSDERLLVVLEPPLGFASRITLDVAYESDLTLNELAALRDGYLDLFYGGDANYTEINRAEQADGRLQVTLLYNNPAGASGRETVYLSQDGPYFSALRIFLSDNETVALGDVMDRVAESYTVNPTARWGEPELEVTAEELEVQGLYGWVDALGNYRVTGRLFNAWQDDVAFLSLSASVCDPSGVVLDDNAALLVNDILPRGGVVPFEVLFGPIDNPEATPCLVQPRAEPASLVSVATYDALEVSHVASLEEGEEEGEQLLVVSGTVLNTGEETVHLIDLIIAVYDGPVAVPESHIIGYALTTTEATQLAPGEASAFTTVFPLGDLGGVPVEVEMWKQANPLEPTPTS